MSQKCIELDDKTGRVLKKKGYQLTTILNSGAFGQVYKAKNIKTGQLAAVKVMELEKLSKKFRDKFLPREMSALIQTNHKHIINIFDIFKSNKRIFMFMEFIGGGDIAGYLKKNGTSSEPKACEWFTQITSALNYLHNRMFIAHRDIKLDNILLTEDHINTKLTDFGFAKMSFDELNNKVIMSDTYCGTEPYYCPQLVNKELYDPFKADVWAMGVVLFAILYNKFPFHFKSLDKMYQEQLDQKFLSDRISLKKISKHCKNLIIQLLNPDESKRMIINEVLKHQWIKEKGICNH